MEPKKELFIVRHAKSSWEIDGISDVDRSLKLRGIRNAYEMARRLKIDRKLPDWIITSPADRALHTATIFVRVFELPYDIITIDETLYSKGPSEILQMIAKQPDDIDKLMIFGHNPDFSELVRTFASNHVLDLPTCGMGIFDFNCNKWSQIDKSAVVNELIEFPKKEFDVKLD